MKKLHRRHEQKKRPLGVGAMNSTLFTQVKGKCEIAAAGSCKASSLANCLSCSVGKSVLNIKPE